MEKAIGPCQSGMASDIFKVPRSTIGDRKSSTVSHGRIGDHEPLLSKEDEEALVQYCKYCSSMGFPLTKARVMAYGTAIRRKRNSGHNVKPLGQTWWLFFRRRLGKFQGMQKVDIRSRCRANQATQPVVTEYFELLEKTLEQHGLKDKPTQIYNCDETGFQKDASKINVLAPKGSKKNNIQAPGTRDRVSVLACFNAAGEDVPPFIIFGKRLPGGPYTKGGPANALYGTSLSGYIDNALFRRWFVNHFIKYAVKTRPLLLMFDGHKSHLDPEVIEAARKENVVLLVLPPNSSHILQPLDLTYFSALKTGFFEVAGDHCHFKNSSVISKMAFPMVLRQPYQQCKERNVVVSGFRKAGIFPFNPSAIDSSKIVPSTSKKHPPQKTATPSSLTPSAPPPAVTPSKYMSHPLVAAGLIDPELAEILTEIDYQKTTTPRPSKMKAPLKARVITEMQMKLESTRRIKQAQTRDGKTPSPRSATPRRSREPSTSPATSPSEGETASPTVKQTSKSSRTRSRSRQNTPLVCEDSESEDGSDNELEAEQQKSKGPHAKRAGLRHKRLDYVDDNSNDDHDYGINQASAKTISPLKRVLRNTHTKIEAGHRNMWRPFSDDEDVSEISDLTSTDFEDNEYEQKIEAMRKAKRRRLMQKKTVPLTESDDDITDDSSDDEPLVKMMTRKPSNEELKMTVKKLVAHVDLEKITMKDIFKRVFKMYPCHDLSNKKTYIKETVKRVISMLDFPLP